MANGWKIAARIAAGIARKIAGGRNAGLRSLPAALLLALAALLVVPAQAQADVLVSNIGQSDDDEVSVSTFAQSISQAFTTGAGGATLTSIEFKIQTDTAIASPPTVTVRSGSATGTAVAVLAGPTSLPAGTATYTFTAPANTDLAGPTTYFAAVEGNTHLISRFRLTVSNDEDTGGTTGWSIADTGQSRSGRLTTGPYSDLAFALLMRVNGTPGTGTPLATDATLSNLALSGVTLAPVFASATTAYTATVAFDVLQTTVTAALNDANATVAILDASDTALADADDTTAGFQVALDVGATVIKVRVTAEDATTTQTYQATVTRQAAVCNAPSLGTRRQIWTGTVVVAAISSIRNGYTPTTSGSSLDDTEFTVGGNDFTIAAVAVQTNGDLLFALDRRLTVLERNALRLHVCGDFYDFDIINEAISGTQTYRWPNSGLVWSAGTTRTLYLSQRANAPAMGAPAISGTAEVGETLAAAQGSIDDDDGLPAAADFAWQWYRQDANGSNRESIVGATSAIYTLADADAGKKIVVSASFIDNLGTGEARRFSVAYPATGTVHASLGVTGASAFEGEAVSFTVTLSPASAATVTVQAATSIASGDTASAADFTALSATTVTFMPGETSQTVTVSTTEDTATEGDETFTLTLTGATNATIGTATATGTIANDDAGPKLQAVDASATEGGSVAFTVMLSEPVTDAEVTVDYTVTAAAGDTATTADFAAVTAAATLTFSPGATTRTVTVATTQDTADEPDETFTLTLSNPSANAGISDTTATGTIDDDDAPPSLSVAPASADEGQGLVFTVSLTAASGKEVTVDYATADGTATTSSTATGGRDYTARSGTLTFAPGDTEKTVTVATRQETTDEDDETLTLTLSDAANAGISDASATGTIADDDDPPSLSVTDLSAGEGQSLVFAVRLSAASGKPVTVSVATSIETGDTASAGDFTALPATALTFAPGVTTRTVTVATTQDTAHEADETFTLRLSGAVNADIGTATATGTIADDDAQPSLSVADASADEGEDVVFTVRLSAASGQPVTVSVAAGIATGDTAVAGDFTAVPATVLTFAPGETEKPVTVSTTQDATDENDETFTLTLSGAANAGIGTATATGTIVDDDPEPALSVADAVATEGGDLVFTVRLSAASGRTVTVNYTISDGTATTATSAPGGADYTARSGRLTFAAGETEKPVTVTTRQDTTDEADETLTLTLSSPSNASLPADPTATGTITDNDSPPALSVADRSVTEGDDLVFAVTLTALSGREVTVDYATSDGTATTATSAPGGADYSSRSGTLTFAPGTRTMPVTVPTADDGTDEDDETLTLTLSTAANASLPADPTATGTIADNDAAPSLSVDEGSADEGGAIGFAVRLSAQSGKTVTVDYATSDGSATTASSAPGGADYTATSGTLSFGPGDTSMTVTVPTGDDTTDEADETLTLTLSGAANAGIGTATATGTIDNDDTAPSLSVEDASAMEGDPLTFTVELAAVSGKTVTVGYATADGTATTASSAPGGADYTARSGTLSFAPGTTTQPVTVPTRQETTDEDDETFTLTLSVPVNAGISDGTATAQIADDDDPPTMSVADADALEGDDIVFTLTLTAVSGKTVAVGYATYEDTAVEDEDYTSVQVFREPPVGGLKFAPGETEKTVTVATTQDETDEADEIFSFELEDADNAVLGNDVATGTIRNDEADPTVTLALTPAQIQESGGQPVSRVTATLSHASATPTTVAVSMTAVAPARAADFEPSANLELTVPANTMASTGTVTLTAVDNDTDAPDKRVTVSATASNPLGIVEPGDAVLTIADDEPPPTVTLALSQATIGEDGGTATVTAALSHPSSEATTVTITPSAGDFTLTASGRIAIPAGATDGTGTVTLTAVDDDTDAPDKRLTVSATAVNDQGIEQPAGVDLTVADDEPAPTVTLSVAPLSIPENGGTAAVSARLNHPSSEPTTVTVTAVAGESEGARFTLSGAVLSVPAGATAATGTATIAAVPNDTDAPDQFVTIDATATNPHGIDPEVHGQLLEIPDDDAAPTVTLELSANPISEENGETAVTAVLSHPSSRATTVTVTAAALAPALAADFVQTGTVLEIAAEATESTGAVTLTAVPNRVDAPDKTVRLSAAAANTQGLAGQPAALDLTVTDDDVRGYAWLPTMSTLSEADAGTAPFTVALTSEPTATVTLTLSSSNGNKLRFVGDDDTYPESRVLTFTPQSWETPQSLMLQALQDSDARHDMLQIRHSAAGGDYQGLVRDYSVTVLDSTDPATGVRLTVDRTRIGEGAGATQVTVQATTEGAPLASAVAVAVTVAGGTGSGAASATDFSASPGSFTLTIPAGASLASRSFTLTPDADGVDEDDETVSIAGTTTATVENGTDVLTVSAAEVVIEDDDTRGVSLSTAELAVGENASATYTAVLDSEPTGDVSIAFASNNTDVTVTTENTDNDLTFTPVNWDTPQTVTVAAADDADTADDEASVSHTVSGADYGVNGVTAAPVAVTVRDGDSVGVAVSERTLTVPEGGQATYTVVLDAQPSATVTVRPLVSGDGDVTVSPATLRFNAASWDTPQTVTVRAREDGDSTDDAATVSHTVEGAAGLAARDVEVTVRDNDQASTGIALTVSPEAVDEQRGRRTVTVTAMLDGAPLAADTAVAVLVRGGTAPGMAAVTDFAADPAALTVTIRAGQRSGTGTFRLTPVNDDVDEDDETVTVSGSTGSLPVTPAAVTIADDDDRGIRLSRQSVPVGEDGERTYTVALTSAPTGEVTMRLSVDDNPDVTVFPETLRFTAATWDEARTVTVRAADDADGDDEGATVTHAVEGADYAGMDPVALPVAVDDDDRASRTVQLALDPASVEEDGGARQVTVTAVLDGAARAAATDVAVTTVSGGSAVAGTDYAVLGAVTVTIPANETSGSQTFTFAPVDDDIDEGLSETVVLGGTAPGLTVRTAVLTVADDDGRGIELSPGPVTLTEEDADGRYTVALATQPTGEVTVRVTVSGNREVTVAPARLTFTADTWSETQPVTVMAAHDDDAADDTAELRHAASGADYARVSALPLAVAVRDNDRRGVTVSAATLTLREGGSATYTVVLDTRPSETVTVTPSLATGSDGDVTVSPSSLSFTTSSWKTPKTVTVRARQDLDEAADRATVEHRVSGADYGDNDVTAAPVGVTVSDDDIPSVEIRLSLSADTVREGGGAQRLTVTAELDGAPETAPVAVTLTLEGIGSGATAGEDFAAAAPVTLTIGAGSTRATARVTIAPVADAIDEGDGERLRIAAATDAPLALVPRGFDVTIDDDDSRGLTLSRTRLTVPEEGSASYTIRLASQPTADVTVDPSGDGDLTVAPARLVFTAADWNTARTVTVSAAEDPDGDDDTATVTHTAFGGDYSLSDIVLPVTVDDNDPVSRTVQLSLDPATVPEDGGPRQVTVTATLDGAARAAATDVAVTVTGGSAVSGTDFAALGAVTVTIPAGQTTGTSTFRFAPVDDDFDEGVGETAILGGTAPSGLTVRTAVLSVADDDTRGLAVAPETLSLGEGGSATLSVRLASRPTGPVTVRIARTGSPDVTVEPSSLSFTATDWNTPQEVAVAAASDADDTDDAASISLRASGADYGGVTAAPVAVTVLEQAICSGLPRVTSVQVTSRPDVDTAVDAWNSYGRGETVRFAVVFAAPVAVTAPGPELVLDVGGEERRAAWTGRSGTDRLTFAWTVAAGDVDGNGLRAVSYDPACLAANDADTALEQPTVLPGSGTHRGGARVNGDRPHMWLSGPTATGGAGTAREGEPYTFRVRRDGGLDHQALAIVSVTDSAFPDIAVFHRREGDGPGMRAAGFGDGVDTVELTMTPPDDGEATTGRELTVTLQMTRAGVCVGPGNCPRRFYDRGTPRTLTVPVRESGSAQVQAQTAAPSMTGLPTVTGPASGDGYAAGERILARVAFDAPVTVDTAAGSPALGLALGGVRRDAAYESGSGTAVLSFALAVAPAEAGAAQARAIANGLVLNGATVRGVDGTDAALAFGQPPGIVSVTVAPDADGDGAWEAGEAVEVTVVFDEPVAVATGGGTPALRALVGSTERELVYARGSGSDTLVFAWTVTQAGGPVTAVLVQPDSLALNGGAIRSTAGLDALLAHDGAARAGAVRRAPPALGVADAEAAEGETLVFRVTLAPAASGPVTVDWATADGPAPNGATAGTDYTAASGTLTFAAGETERTVPVTVLADDAAEGAETLTLTLSNPAGAEIATGAAAGTIAPSAASTGSSVPRASFTASFSGVPPEHDGAGAFTLTLAFGAEPAGLSYKTVRDSLFTVAGGTVIKARRLKPPSNRRYELTVAPAGDAAVTLALAQGLPACGKAGSVCTADGRTLTGPLSATVPGPAALSVADARAHEAPGAVLAFRITLDRTRHAAVTVDYATADGVAKAGADYTAASGTLVFAVGETERTVEVAVLDDSEDEGSETMVLRLSNPVGARIADGEATGTIENSDAMPQAWLARFGRTVAEQAIEAVEARLAAPRAPGVEVTLAGQRIGGAAADAEALEEEAARAKLAALGDWLRDGARPGAQDDDDPRRQVRTVTERELLTGSSFALTGEPGGGGEGIAALWGRGAVLRFDGRTGSGAGALMLEGEVASAMLGADWTRGPWLAGLLLSHSRGTGSYRGASAGKVESALTGLYPYGRYAVNPRLSVWGVAGYGAGTLTLTPDGEKAIGTDMDLMMGAVGVRGVALEAPAEGGVELAVKSDALAVRTRSEAVRAEASGSGSNLAAATADVTRLRLGLEGTWRGLKLGSGELVPRLEVGVRHDGGDAETGFGLDLGGGLAWSDPKRGLSAELRGRGLLTHESRGFRDRGVSGALTWEPGAGTGTPGRGPKLTLSQTLGGSASGGADALLGRGPFAGLAANDNAEDDLRQRRLEIGLGYGFSAFGDRFTSTPEIGFALTDTGRDYRLGWRLTREERAGGSLELSLEATRREKADDASNDNGSRGVEHGIGFRLTARF